MVIAYIPPWRLFKVLQCIKNIQLGEMRVFVPEFRFDFRGNNDGIESYQQLQNYYSQNPTASVWPWFG